MRTGITSRVAEATAIVPQTVFSKHDIRSIVQVAINFDPHCIDAKIESAAWNKDVCRATWDDIFLYVQIYYNPVRKIIYIRFLIYIARLYIIYTYIYALLTAEKNDHIQKITYG